MKSKGLPALFWLLSFTVCLPLQARHPADIPPLDAELRQYAYPFPVQFISLPQQQQTLRMAYMDIAPAGKANGRTILLLHGKNFNSAYWETTIRQLTAAGYRVIAPDQIGFGKSSKPAYYQYSFQQLAANTRQLLATLGLDHATVIGHSMGGMLATRFALMYPEVTQQLVLVNPIGLEDYRLHVPWRSIDWWYQRELAKDYATIRDYQRNSYYDGQWSSEYERWARLAAGWTRDADYPRVAWNSALTYDMIYSQPVVHEFSLVSSPTLLIIGTRDRTALGRNLVSAELQQQLGRYDQLGKITQARIPHAQLAELPGIGHLPHIEAFDRFRQALLPFLDSYAP